MRMALKQSSSNGYVCLGTSLVSCWVIGLLLNATSSFAYAQPRSLDELRTKDELGNVRYQPVAIADEFRNEWPEELEDEFQARARIIVDAQSQRKVSAGNTYFENEKRTYGFLMAQALGERGMDAIHDLQNEDAQADEWHRHTNGIDFYAAFTLKHQMRKYFLFGGLLDREYRDRMAEGGKLWTARDPLRRSHYAYESPKPGWGPDAKNSWVDVRSTENLFLMRVTSVYLMAEDAGNRETTESYKRLILDYAMTLYRIGMGEWDSENYHGHSIAPLLNLYDFAKDREVKLAAKACLDWMMAAGAVKYFQGGFTGPTKRDYNHVQPFGGSAATMLWVYFGDSRNPPSHWESDEVHIITSAYRPPLAVVELARKRFDRPIEIFASKPSYSATTSLLHESTPAYLETQWVGRHCMMGSLAGGTRPGKDDVNGFKIIVEDRERGGVVVQGVPGPDPEFPGSPQYQEGKVSGPNRVAQYQNLAIWLAQNGDSDWRWVVPDSMEMETTDGVIFLRTQRAWIALRPLGTSELQLDRSGTRLIAEGEKPRFPKHKVLSCKGRADSYCGVIVEVGDAQTHRQYSSFKTSVLAGEVDASKLVQGIVQYKAEDGKWLGFHWNDNPHDLGCWRNGRRHDWAIHGSHLYRTHSMDSEVQVIESVWGQGELSIQTSNARFVARVDENGLASFDHSVSER